MFLTLILLPLIKCLNSTGLIHQASFLNHNLKVSETCWIPPQTHNKSHATDEKARRTKVVRCPYYKGDRVV